MKVWAPCRCGGTFPPNCVKPWAAKAWCIHGQATVNQPLVPLTSNGVAISCTNKPKRSCQTSIALLAAAHMKTIQGVVVLAPHIFVEDISVASIAETRAAYLNPNTQLKQRLGRHHVDVDSAFWGWNNIWLHPEFRHWRIDHELSDIDCPVLAIQGRDDEYGTLAQIEGIAQILSQCECLVLDHCGHSPHKDQPQALTASVKSFFKQHQPPIFGDQHETP
jgi:pimeloyl-ACP methyl ester carboxylesterase